MAKVIDLSDRKKLKDDLSRAEKTGRPAYAAAV